jgi:flagellar biosynthetic protein FliR
VSWSDLFSVELPVFLAVLGRTSGLLISAPYFQSQTIPVTLRAGIALLLALVLSPVLGLQPGPWLQGNLWVLTVLGEVLTGLAMGYIMNLLFAAVQLGGQLIEVPMGFGMVNILDPQTGGEMPIIGQLHQLLTTWLFLLFQGDHLIIRALARSYELLPPAAFTVTALGVKGIVRGFCGMFLLGVQIALPIMGAIFLADVALGIISRLIPQLNVFFTGFPIKIAMGILLLILILPVFLRLAANFASPGGDIWQLLQKVLPLFKG